MTAVRWEFPHPELVATCIAEFDGAVLEVNCTSDHNGTDMPSHGLRTCVLNRDAAYRELRAFGAERDDLDRSEMVL